MEHFYTINSSIGLIRESYHGIIHFEFVASCIKKIKTDTQFKEDYSIIVDLTDCWIDGDRQELDLFMEFHNQTIKDTGVTALVADKPNTVVMAVLFQNLCDRPCEIFNQFNNALNWAISHRIERQYQHKQR
jgi:hypothetical protein